VLRLPWRDQRREERVKGGEGKESTKNGPPQFMYIVGTSQQFGRADLSMETFKGEIKKKYEEEGDGRKKGGEKMRMVIRRYLNFNWRTVAGGD